MLGASFDTVEDNRKFAEKFVFPFPLLSVTRDMAIQYGAADSKDQTTAKRVAYVIGPDGRIKHVWPKATPQSFATDVLAVL